MSPAGRNPSVEAGAAAHIQTGHRAEVRSGRPSEPITISPVRIVQATPKASGPLGPEYRIIRDFGAVVAENRTLFASVSLCGDGNDTPVVSGDTNDVVGNPVSAGPLRFPATGGVLPLAGMIRAAILAGALIMRRIIR